MNKIPTRNVRGDVVINGCDVPSLLEHEQHLRLFSLVFPNQMKVIDKFLNSLTQCQIR